MKYVLILLTALFVSFTSLAQKTYYYEVAWRNLNIGYYYITFVDASENVSDSITIQVLGDHNPRNRAKVIWASGDDTIISETDSHGEISIRRDTNYLHNVVTVEIFPAGDMYLPIKQYVYLWEWSKRRIPTQITFELEIWNPWEIRIESDHPLSSFDIEHIRDSVSHNKANPPKFDGIRYETIYEL